MKRKEMPTPKKSTSPISRPTSTSPFLAAVVIISLVVNGYLLLNKKEKHQKLLASAGSQSFRWKDISEPGKRVMSDLDWAYYSTLKREADLWIENQVLPKEAQALSMSVMDLIKREVTDKISVTKDEVYQRYVQSPRADNNPWPQVLTDIENELKQQKQQEVKQKFIESLYTKYEVRTLVKDPGGNTSPSSLVQNTRFPVYKRSESPAPFRGSANAPVSLEVFSDFMCPYSVRFNGTVQELQKAYPDKLQVVFRHFPLPMHQGAHLMGEAALCAEEQGKFWEYHDNMMTQAKKREKPELVQIASDLGLSTPKFSDCLDSGRHVKKVDDDILLGKNSGVKGTPGYLINGRLGSGAVPVETLKTWVNWHLNPNGVYPGKPQSPANQAGKGAQVARGPGLDPAKTYPMDAAWLKKGFSRGDDKAPVTLVEFFDYNCPFCKKGAEVSDALAAQYGSKLKIISKHLPLPMHPNASKTSEALLCANEQSKFMELRKEVLGESWGKNSPDDLKVAAKKIGLNESAFNTCLDSGKFKATIDEDMKMAAAIGAKSTPTFMVNGSPVIGAQPVEAFKKVIDEKLNSSDPKEKSAS